MKTICKSIFPIFLLASVCAHATDFRYQYTLTQTVPYQWSDTDAIYGEWIDKGDAYSCANWSPSPSVIGKGLTFTQTATDCKQDQVRTVYPQQKDERTGKVAPIPGAEFQQSQTVDITETRDGIGILENWMSFDPSYTSWKDTNSLYGCTSWSPDPAIYTSTINFTQNSTTCKTDQERLRQEREQEKYTLEIRNTGAPVVEEKTLSDQNASRPYSVKLGPWTESKAAYACSNWSPDPSTIGKSISFEQSASDCRVDQTRTRTESYVDHKTGIKTDVSKPSENQVLTNQPSKRTAIGTQESWGATDPVYSAWTNTPGKILYTCSNWSPAGSSKATSGSFTQTATDCKTDQTRTRQDREIEDNTQEIRNKGSVVTENQTLSSQTATRSYAVSIAAWADNGALTSCTNWSPAPATVTIGQSFTQTATDCLQLQTRVRDESYIDHLTGNNVAVSSVTQSQSIPATGTRTTTGTKETWVAATPTYTAWTNTNALYGCAAWTPVGSSKTVTGTFSQTAADCETDQTRNRQDREQESTTLAYRNKGTPVVENQTLTSQTATRSYTVTLGSWTNSGAKYGCTNWSPAPSTVTIGQSFTQTATDCEQDQTRTRAESYVDHKTGTTMPVTVPAETQTLTGQTSTQTATGTKETWVAATPTYTAWTNTNALYGCVAWTPASSSKTITVTFTQTAADCKTDQTRNRQDREQESTTLVYRNNGAVVAENQTLTGQTATRSYTVTLGSWTNSGAKYACTNWSPAPSTVTIGQSFTQTATDCKQDQTRTRAESYVDHKSGSTVAVTVPAETQTLTGQSSTQTATGTKETWVAATPTYTAWTNTNALYGCVAWTPTGSSKTVTGTFTQTAADCETDQTRNRQDREQESTTLAYRNKGTPVAETQTLTSQTATRSYTVTLGSWTNNGAKYGCTNWSPAPSTVTIGQSFTQTATDCEQDQTRTRAESYVDHKTGSTVPVTVPADTQTITGQSSTQTATGTKETWVAATPTYTAWVNTNALYGCVAWTPTGSSKTVTGTFTQTAADCETDQTRNRQDREQESTTLAYRNKGTPVAETQTLTSQTATRSYTVTLGSWANNGAKYGCTNWSPAPSTVTIGQSFTQTATDCEQDQTRTRAESYVDHKTGTTMPVTVPADTQTITGQSSTQTATGTKETWVAATPTYTAWVNTNALYGCAAWTPTGSSKTVTGTFTQTAADCETDQTRNRQDREQESTTLAYRNKGTPVVENQTLTSQTATRSYTVTLGSWANSGAKYACTNWSPAPSTVTIGQSFTQTATDCKQDQTRTRAESYVDHKTGTTMPVTVPADTQTLTGQSNTQTATGTKETWVAATPTYTAWVNTNALYGCVAWTPASSTKTITGTFTQTAADCETDQTRNRQDREQESTTLAYRNKGTPVVENQTLTSQTATRSYTVTLGSWTNSGAKYACTNWSPAPATVTIGQSFTQTATDCKQDQTRTRAESYVDHKSGSTVAVTVPAETQTLTGQTSTQTATGTKETWVATTSVYSAWGNTSGAYSCTNWSPDPSTVTINQVYTQTATNCYVNQSRTRQDRQVETTTGAIRNNGAVVTETQTIGGQTGYQSATGTKQTWAYYPPVYGGWYNTSGVYGCSAWSPDPYTVNSGTAFTQTGTGCYINQARSRQDRLYETTTGQVINNGAAVTEGQTVGGQVTYQTAYGTKPWTGCRNDGANYVYFYEGGGKNNPMMMQVVWDGGVVYNANAGAVSYYPVVGGFTYYSGDNKNIGYHTVCRG